MKKFKRIVTVGHNQSTFWSPFHVYYMPFQISGSQESNASNGMQIGAEMKKLWLLEANRTKLKGNFASCEITKCQLRNQPFCAKWRLSACEILQPMLHAAKSTLVFPDICDRLFQIFSSDICCLNPHFLLVIHKSQDSLVSK